MESKEKDMFKELEYKEFEDYEVESESIGFIDMGCINHKFIFPNGYGASVIKDVASYRL